MVMIKSLSEIEEPNELQAFQVCRHLPSLASWPIICYILAEASEAHPWPDPKISALGYLCWILKRDFRPV